MPLTSEHYDTTVKALKMARRLCIMEDIARIDAALQAIALDREQEAGQWEPLPPGTHYIEYSDFSMTVSLDGSLLTMQALDGECYQEMYIQLNHGEYRLCRLSPRPTAVEVAGNDDNGGRRWWRLKRDEDSSPWCINISEMEYFWLQGWRPEYPLQTQPLTVNGDAPGASGGSQ